MEGTRAAVSARADVERVRIARFTSDGRNSWSAVEEHARRIPRFPANRFLHRCPHNEEQMSSSGEFETELARVRRRYRIVIALMAFGACVLVAAVLVGALAALDHRVAESYFRDDPGRAHGKSAAVSSAPASTTGAAAATVSGGTNSPAPAPNHGQAVTGGNGSAADTMLDTQPDDIRTHARHRRRHHRR